MTIDGEPDGFPDVGRPQAVRTIQACADLGINLVDSAEIYGDGEGERRVGEAIRGRRDRWIVSTKFGMRRGPDGRRVRDLRPEAIAGSLEGSLRRLGTDYLDLYLYHHPPGPADLDATTEVLSRLRREGKIRHFGISTADPLLVGSLARRGLDVVMFPYSLRRSSSALRRAIRRGTLGGIVRGVFEGGLLTGRYDRGATPFPADDIRSRRGPVDGSEIAALRELLPPGMSMATLALRYVLDSETTHCAVIGATSPDRYREAMESFRAAPLDAVTTRALRRLGRRLEGNTFLGRLRRAGLSRLRGLLR